MNSIFDGRFLKIMFFTFRKNISLELNVLLRNGLVCHNVHSKLYAAVRKHLKNSEHLNFKNGCIC